MMVLLQKVSDITKGSFRLHKYKTVSVQRLEFMDTLKIKIKMKFCMQLTLFNNGVASCVNNGVSVHFICVNQLAKDFKTELYR